MKRKFYILNFRKGNLLTQKKYYLSIFMSIFELKIGKQPAILNVEAERVGITWPCAS
jgi:hypothetical protein